MDELPPELGPPSEGDEPAELPPEEARRLEAARWFQQAEADLVAARDNVAAGHHNWACYMAEQAAEKAVKAVYVFRDLQFRRIHTIADLILGNSLRRVEGVPGLSHLDEAANGLDNVMTSSRSPDAVPYTEAPAQYFTDAQAEECIEWAQQIVNAVRNLLPNT